MGNRAYVVFMETAKSDMGVAVYLHWNGGPESVYAFLDYTASVTRTDSYFPARFCQVAGNYLAGDDTGGALSLGIEPVRRDDIKSLAGVGDNGVYVVDLSKFKRGAPVARIMETLTNPDAERFSDYKWKVGRFTKAQSHAERMEAESIWNTTQFNGRLPVDLGNVNRNAFQWMEADSLFGEENRKAVLAMYEAEAA